MIIVGLGNPGEEYKNTRHNSGRDIVSAFAKKIGTEFEFDKKSNALLAEGKAGNKITFILPETFMNKSGSAVGKFVTSVKKAKDLIVVHDDLDIPLGRFKMSFNKSSGGHKGVESIIKTLKTQAFWRLRIGISPATASGKLKKPSGDALINNFIVAPFTSLQETEMKKVMKKAVETLNVAATMDPQRAMMESNRN